MTLCCVVVLLWSLWSPAQRAAALQAAPSPAADELEGFYQSCKETKGFRGESLRLRAGRFERTFYTDVYVKRPQTAEGESDEDRGECRVEGNFLVCITRSGREVRRVIGTLYRTSCLWNPDTYESWLEHGSVNPYGLMFKVSSQPDLESAPLPVLEELRASCLARKLSRDRPVQLVDLSLHSEIQTLVDREAGQYLGHVTTVLLDDHRTMFAVYPKGHGKGTIVMKRSPDGGRTWSERLPTPESWKTSLEVPTLFRVRKTRFEAQRKPSRLLLFSGLYPIRCSVSQDSGATWSELAPIGTFGGIVAMSCIRARVRSQHLDAYFHDDGSFLGPNASAHVPLFQVYRCTSSDAGLHWSEPESLLCNPDWQWCEPCVLPGLGWNQPWAMLLRENSRKSHSFISFSGDEGSSWSAPKEVSWTLTGDRHTACHTLDGRVFIAFRDMAGQSPTYGDWVAWVGTYADLQNGSEGQYRVRLLDNHEGTDCGYSGLETLPDGTLVTTTYGHWTPGQPPYIVSLRFTLDQLDSWAAAGRPRGEK